MKSQKDMPKNKTISALIEVLMDKGIVTAKTKPGAHQTVHQWIRTGKLKPRQRPHSGYYLFTDDEISQIATEFDVGGKGWWSYKEKIGS